jgi:aspartate carbamoyltransferase catalytic subunit
MNNRFDGWPHVIRAQQFSREWLEAQFLPLTDEMQTIVDNRGCQILSGRKMICLFYQPSTRTRMSFEFAMRYLGGDVAFTTENAREFSSAKKGETLGDTLRVINRYRPDVIVICYDQEFDPRFITEASKAPVINAGDRGMGQHPTQALLDLRTIFKRQERIDGLRVAMVGDLDQGRTARSLSYMLGKFRDVVIYFVSPPNTKMGQDVKDYLNRHHILFQELIDLREVADMVDVIYQTRAQVECGTKFDRSQGYFVVDKTILDMMREDAVIMHPLPRVDEITTEVDQDPRAVYLSDQIDSGLFARMALLKMILA